MRAPIGFRIRNQRKSLAISQARLAKTIGISASYLNLIEASKRDVGGALLQKIAKSLELNIEQLTGESEQRLITDLGEAFADPIMGEVNLSQSEIAQMVVRSPKMANSFVQLYRAYVDSNASNQVYSNRLRADPLFSELLHQVLSQVTAIRSSAEILETVGDLSVQESGRFLASIGHESRLMSDVAQTLIGHFDQTSQNRRSITPTRELDDYIIEEHNYFPLLEDAALSLRLEIVKFNRFDENALLEQLENKFSITLKNPNEKKSAKRNIDDKKKNISTQFEYCKKSKTVWFSGTSRASTRQFQLALLYAQLSVGDLIKAQSNDPFFTLGDTKKLAAKYIASYIAGAMIFPYDEFLQDVQDSQYDIDHLGQKYTASFEQVAHRLVTLRQKEASGVAFGFLRSDPAGRLTKHFPLPGLLLPNSGHACPLWAIYGAFASSEPIVRQVVRFADGSRYFFIAKTTSKRLSTFNSQRMNSSVMLACDINDAKNIVYSRGLDLENEDSDVEVGPSCRLCTLKHCVHRQEPALYPV